MVRKEPPTCKKSISLINDASLTQWLVLERFPLPVVKNGELQWTRLELAKVAGHGAPLFGACVGPRGVWSGKAFQLGLFADAGVKRLFRASLVGPTEPQQATGFVSWPRCLS